MGLEPLTFAPPEEFCQGDGRGQQDLAEEPDDPKEQEGHPEVPLEECLPGLSEQRVAR